MRALIIASVSDEILIEPSRIWATKFLTRSLPRSFAAVSRPNRPCSTIWSSRPNSEVCPAAAAACASLLAIGCSLGTNFTTQLVHLLFVAHGLLQDLLELVVALQA